jgi:predicted site-specific integrase-resolvase
MAKFSDYAKRAEAADTLGVSQNTLRSWAGAGKIPVLCNPANGHPLFLKADLEKFLQKVAASGTKPPSQRKRP